MATELISILIVATFKALSDICSIICHRKQASLLIGIAVAVLTIPLAHGTAVACDPDNGEVN